MIDKVIDKILDLPLVKKIIQWFMKLTLPGFDGMPLHKVIGLFIQELQNDKIGPRASAISFSFMLALFPFIIFTFSLIPVIPVPGLQEEIFSLLRSVLPSEAFHFAKETIEDTITQKRVELTSVVFLMMIVFATNGMNAVLKSFSKTNVAFKSRGFFREYFVAFILTIILTLFFVIALVLLIFGTGLIGVIMSKMNLQSNTSFIILFILKWLIVVTLYFLAISIIYYFAPALKKKGHFITAGGTVATFLSILASIGFSNYVNNFGQYNKFYGSIGAMLVIMIWIYINSLVLLIGFEINNSIRNYQMSRKIREELESNDAILGV